MKYNDLIGATVRNAAPLQLEGSILEALEYEGTTMMAYMGPPQSSYRRPLNELHVEGMLKVFNESGLDIKQAVIHAPYIVNPAQDDPEKRQYCVDFISKEVHMAASAGFKKIVLHPGAYLKQSISDGLNHIALSINEILANNNDSDIKILVETMAGKGSEACHTFEEMSELLKMVPADRVDVCFDTCHTWDAGYNTKDDYEGVLAQFDSLIGLKRIGAIHLNDSKNSCGARKDRHQNLGYGYIGFETLYRFYSDPIFKDIPKILETPYVGDNAPYKQEIAMLRNHQFDEHLQEKCGGSHE